MVNWRLSAFPSGNLGLFRESAYSGLDLRNHPGARMVVSRDGKTVTFGIGESSYTIMKKVGNSELIQVLKNPYSEGLLVLRLTRMHPLNSFGEYSLHSLSSSGEEKRLLQVSLSSHKDGAVWNVEHIDEEANPFVKAKVDRTLAGKSLAFKMFHGVLEEVARKLGSKKLLGYFLHEMLESKKTQKVMRNLGYGRATSFEDGVHKYFYSKDLQPE